jgi:guanine deaminase
MARVSYPDWIHELVDWHRSIDSHEERMALASDIACRNVTEGGGPFGALITDAAGRIISVGYNCVHASCDSTAHAEILAIRNAEAKLKTHRLDDLHLYSSGDPCIMCFGAIWWSGLSSVHSAAGVEVAESAGFSEGPITPQLWEVLRAQKNTAYVPNFGMSPALAEAYAAFQRGGTSY